MFQLFFGLFQETKKRFFGLFRCFGPVKKQPKQTNRFETNITNRREKKRTAHAPQGEAQALVDKTRTGASQKTCAGPLQATC
jgi:hypothetical protein